MTAEKINFSKDLLKEIVKITKEELKQNRIANAPLFAIFEKLHELEYDESFYALVKSHVKTLCNVISRQKSNFEEQRKNGRKNELEFISSEELNNFVISKLFLDTVKSFSKKISIPVKDTFEKDFNSVLLEAFLKPNDTDKNNFLKDLKKYDILFAEVTKSSFPLLDREMIELRFISKEDEKKTIVYHLNILCFMLKKEELDYLQRNEVSIGEIWKVTFLGFAPPRNENICVTTNKDCFRHFNDDQKNSLHLGLASAKDLHFDFDMFKSASKFTSYAHYLRSNLDFHHLHDLNEMVLSIGIDPCRIYSFSEKRDGLTFPSSQGEMNRVVQSKLLVKEAIKLADEKDYLSALTIFEESLELWDKNPIAYESRGKMYIDWFGLKASSSLKKACYDFECTLKLNPSSKIAKEYFSNIFVYCAKRQYMKKNYAVAGEHIITALSLMENNDDAVKLLSRINKKMKHLSNMET